MSNTFKAGLVIDFAFDEQTAAHILSDPMPEKALTDYVNSHTANDDGVSNFCVRELQQAFGVHLTVRKIEEAKQLTVSTTT